MFLQILRFGWLGAKLYQRPTSSVAHRHVTNNSPQHKATAALGGKHCCGDVGVSESYILVDWPNRQPNDAVYGPESVNVDSEV